MTRHPYDGNMIAADAHYDRPVPPRDGGYCPAQDCPGTLYVCEPDDDTALCCDTCERGFEV